MTRENALRRLLADFKAGPEFLGFFEAQYSRLTDNADSIDMETYRSIVEYIRKYFR